MEELFKDELVEMVRSAGGRVMVGGFEVLLPRRFGFCRGVTRAVGLALDSLEGPGRRLLLGEIIHNPAVNRLLVDKGVEILSEDSFQKVLADTGPDDRVIIPAFGVDLDMENWLHRNFTGPVVDATCEDVKRIWEFVARESREGRTVILFGKPSHAEIRAILSRAHEGDNAVVVVPTVAAASAFAALLTGEGAPSGEPGKLRLREILESKWPLSAGVLTVRPKRAGLAMSLASQTTMLHGETRVVAEVIARALEAVGGDLRICHTICRATQDRQDAARELCVNERPDAAFVVGGHDSSNTTNLFRIASALVSPCFFIEGPESLHPADATVSHYLPDRGKVATSGFPELPRGSKVAILAGASCPRGVVGRVIRRLGDFGRGA